MAKTNKIPKKEGVLNIARAPWYVAYWKEELAVGILAGAGILTGLNHINNLNKDKDELVDNSERQRDNASANESAALAALNYTNTQLASSNANNSALTQKLVDMGVNVTYLQNLLNVTSDNYSDIYNLLNQTVERFQYIYNAYNVTNDNWGQSNDTHLQEMDDLYQQFQDMMEQQNVTHAQAIANLQDIWAQYNLTVYNNGAPTGLSARDLDYLFEYDANTSDGIPPLPSPLTNEEKNKLLAIPAYIEIRKDAGWDIVKAEMNPAKNAEGDYLVNMDTQFVWYLENKDTGVTITDTLDVKIPSSLYFKIKDNVGG